LYDVIDENGNGTIFLGTNQLFAANLPFELIEGNYAEAASKIV